MTNAPGPDDSAGQDPSPADYVPDAGVMAAAREFRDAVLGADGIESVTLSAGGRTVTLSGGAARQGRFDDGGGGDTFPMPDETEFIDPAWIAAGGSPTSRNAPVLDFCHAPAIAEVGRMLIDRHRRRFPHLHKPFSQTVEFFWKRVGGDTAGRMTLGACKKTPPLMRAYTSARWIIWIAADNCRGLTPRQMEALVFHELLHTGMDDKAKPKLQGHDVEEFRAVIEEYGFIFHDLRALRDSVQLALFTDGGDGEGDA